MVDRRDAPAPVLEARDISKRYGGVRALSGADLTVLPGEVHALVGENGSGKSTLLGILSGQRQPDRGVVAIDGVRQRLNDPAVALDAGIATVTQETTLVPDLTIAENVLLGRRLVRRRGRIDWRATRAKAREALGRLELELDPGLPVRRLRPDQQQMVEIARAISFEARVLILDEPTSSLTDDEVEALVETVRRLQRSNVATIFVSHRIQEVMDIADRVTVLRDGVTVGGGPIADYTPERLISQMVGRAVERFEHAEQRAASNGHPLLRLRGLSVPGHVHGVDLDVGAGEIVGLAGLVGAGRSELLEAVFGLRTKWGGAVVLDGQQIAPRSPRHAVASGIGYVPPDRKQRGVVLTMSVRENLLMASSCRRMRLRSPSKQEEASSVATALDDFRISTSSPDAAVSTLSGGNQQKVVLSKWLSTNPRMLLLDEPTRGVDVGAKGEIYRLLAEAREAGVSVLVSSSETPELLLLCDRVAVMFRGRLVGSLVGREATEARIATLATGQR